LSVTPEVPDDPDPKRILCGRTFGGDPARRSGGGERLGGASALAEFRVSGLAGHLAAQLFRVRELLALPAPADEPISLLDHYGRSAWVGAGLDDEVNVGVPTPALPDDVLDLVFALLVRLSAGRHGGTAVLRAFSRAERAPATIAAF
jgi:hypothetical protein